MDLASGYSDGFNYGNGYTPLANNAINNNNLAYNANQNYANMAGMYNPFAQSGGFGAMTDYYSNAGAAYGRATGGFGGGGAAAWDPYAYGGSSGGIGSDAARAPDQPQPDWMAAVNQQISGGSFNDRFSAAPQVDYRLQPTPSQQLPQGIYDGVFAPTQPRSVTVGDDFQSRFGDWGNSGAGQYFMMEQQQQQQNALRDQLAAQQASFNDRWGNLPGQPYGQGYFDNTFGSVANTGGTSQQPYQGNPFYMPQPMPAQQPVWGGGGFGASGFGIGQSNYMGQPGFGLGIGGVGAPGGGANVGNTYGTSGQNPAMGGGAPDYGYGGLSSGITPFRDTWTNAS